MASEKEKLQKILEVYEKTLIKRAAIAYDRSPANFFDEAFLLELVIDLKRKLKGSKP